MIGVYHSLLKHFTGAYAFSDQVTIVLNVGAYLFGSLYIFYEAIKWMLGI